jgi:hypothetical protein
VKSVNTLYPQGGNEVVVSVSGKTDGKVANDKKKHLEFRISGPTGTIRGETGVVKGP